MSQPSQHGGAHPHGHPHVAHHGHRHAHGLGKAQQNVTIHEERAPSLPEPQKGRILTIRSHSGLSGDMFLAGLAIMLGLGEEELHAAARLVMPELASSVSIRRAQANGIGGWHACVALPHVHEHRTLADIRAIIGQGGLSDEAKRLSLRAFSLLAEAEARVHGKRAEEVAFHEAGALDSILDTCLACSLFVRLAPAVFRVSPLPMADGSVTCAHGVIPTPAPAVVELLPGLAVRPFDGVGETVTPTAAALLHALGADFGPWPAMTVERSALILGTRVFENAPNGALFAIGSPCEASAPSHPSERDQSGGKA